MENEEPKTCTTSGRPVDVVRAEQTEAVGQHKDYIILCPDERAKGFVRPYRDKYIHVGKLICAKARANKEKRLGGQRYICTMSPDHKGICTDNGFYKWVSQPEHAKIRASNRIDGCGVETKMGQALSETWARDIHFYGATFCVKCNKHLPVGEFEWSADGETVGS